MFTEDSRNLINEISPYIQSLSDNKNFIKKRIVDNSVKYIYNEIVQANKKINNILENNEIYQTIELFNEKSQKRPSFPSVFTSRFVPEYIQRYTKQHILGYSQIMINLFGHNITLKLALLNEDDVGKNLLEDNLIFNILVWLYIASKHSKKNCAETLDIYCYMTPFKKYLPNNNYNILSPEHCNSAVTTTCTKNGEICIYRKEEFLKVLIHESFHIFGLDFSSMPILRLQKKVLSIFPIQSEMEISESYTETWATIMNCFICGYNMLEEKTFEEFLIYADYCIRIEQIFSLFQTVKILNFMNMDYKNLYDTDQISIAARRYLYKEHTNVFPYYILKTLFLCNIDKFLGWCLKENKTNLLNFNKTSDSIDKFGNLIAELYKKKSFLKQLKKAEKIEKSKTSSTFIKTTRMTLFEIN